MDKSHEPSPKAQSRRVLSLLESFHGILYPCSVCEGFSLMPRMNVIFLPLRALIYMIKLIFQALSYELKTRPQIFVRVCLRSCGPWVLLRITVKICQESTRMVDLIFQEKPSPSEVVDRNLFIRLSALPQELA